MGLSSYKMSKILLMGRKRELCSAVELPEPNGTSCVWLWSLQYKKEGNKDGEGPWGEAI